MHQSQPKIPNTPIGFIFFAIKRYRRLIFVAIFVVFLSQLFSDIQPYVFRGLIDSANSFGSGTGSINSVLIWVLAFPVSILLTVGAIRTAGFILNYLTVHARTETIKILFEYLSLHSLSYFSDRFSGALSNRVTTIAHNISRLLSQFIWGILSVFFSSIVTLVLIASSNVFLALIFLGGFVILVPINFGLTRRQIVLSEKMAATAAKLRGQVIDIISNISAVQQYARRDHEINRLDKSIGEHRQADIASDNYRERILLINNILVVLFVAGITFGAFRIWAVGEITVGEFVMIVTLVAGFVRALSHIGQNLNNIMEIYGEIGDGLKEIALPHTIVDRRDAKKLTVTEGRISFNKVTFSYEDNSSSVFQDLTLAIRGGEKIGIVGASGSGKSTLVKLLLRQHDIVSGSISIDGQDITEISQESLRENISIVPQEPFLFHRTIKENIIYGKLEATEEEIINVAKKARAHDFIDMLPEKYNSLVGERGIKLSVGQRQRIAIARAFLKDAPMLILDEATSALDSESEVAIQKALHNLMEKKTVIAIAHRLSTLREMDRLLVFKDGKIIESGTHSSLLEKKDGVYASLWKHQAGGFI